MVDSHLHTLKVHFFFCGGLWGGVGPAGFGDNAEFRSPSPFIVVLSLGAILQVLCEFVIILHHAARPTATLHPPVFVLDAPPLRDTVITSRSLELCLRPSKVRPRHRTLKARPWRAPARRRPRTRNETNSVITEHLSHVVSGCNLLACLVEPFTFPFFSLCWRKKKRNEEKKSPRVHGVFVSVCVRFQVCSYLRSYNSTLPTEKDTMSGRRR